MIRVLVLFSTIFCLGPALLAHTSCSSHFKKASDLDRTDVFDEKIRLEYKGDIDKVDKYNHYTIKYQDPKSKNTVYFRGNVHTAMVKQHLREKFNKDVYDDLEKHKDIIKTIIIERSNDELSRKSTTIETHPTLVEHIAGKELNDVLANRSEIETTIWYATHNDIALKGGEPEAEDFEKILFSPEIGISQEDYDFFKLFRCISQAQRVTLEKAPKHWLSTKKEMGQFDKCCERQDTKHLKDKRIAFEEWFSAKMKQKPYPYRLRSTKRCQTMKIKKDLQHMFDSGCYDFDAGPEGITNKESISYIASTQGKVKNFCLTNAILENLKRGNVFVIYGAGHLFETYNFLKKEICKDSPTCPAPTIKSKSDKRRKKA
jgi:hypothetical protein